MTEKVKVPQRYADWLDEQTVSSRVLAEYVMMISKSITYSYFEKVVPMNESLHYWTDYNWETALLAIINGYEVEKPKRGFKLNNGKYVSEFANYSHEDFAHHSIANFEVNVADKFKELPDWQIEELKKLVIGEVVEADD